MSQTSTEMTNVARKQEEGLAINSESSSSDDVTRTNGGGDWKNAAFGFFSLSVIFLIWAIVMSVLYGGSSKSNSSSTITVDTSTIITQSIWYDKNDFVSWVENCNLTAADSGCLNEYYSAPLYNSANKAVGEVSFFDNLQNYGTPLYVSEQATYTFTDPDYIGWFIYQYSFLSETGSSVWPDGYTYSETSYNSASKQPVMEALVVEGTKRNVNITYDTATYVPQSTTNQLALTYDKTDWSKHYSAWDAPCQTNATDGCTIEYYNAPLYDTNNTEVGNVQFYDILINSADGALWVTEYATYQFTDSDGEEVYFTYSYAFESNTGTSVWPPGFSIDVNAMTATNNQFTMDKALVWTEVRYVVLNYNTIPQAVASTTNQFNIRWNKNDFILSAAPCSSTAGSNCTLEYYNAPLYDASSNIIGNAMFFDIVAKNRGTVYVQEFATLQFTDNMYIPFFSYMLGFESDTGSSVWADGEEFQLYSYASSGSILVYMDLIVDQTNGDRSVEISY